MDCLPNEMLFAISNYLGSNEHKTLRLVTPIWHDVATEKLSKNLKPVFQHLNHLRNFCSTFSSTDRTNLCHKFKNFGFRYPVFQYFEAAFPQISTFCNDFGTNLTKLDLDLHYPGYHPHHRNGPVGVSKVIENLLTKVADTVKELRLTEYSQLNDNIWNLVPFQALENLELLDGSFFEPLVKNQNGDTFVIALSKNIPRIRRIQIKDCVNCMFCNKPMDPSLYLPFLRNVTTSNLNVTLDLNFTIYTYFNANLTMRKFVEVFTSMPGLNVTQFQLRIGGGLMHLTLDSLRMLLGVFSTMARSLRHLTLFRFKEFPPIGDLPSLPNLETLEYYHNRSTTVFQIHGDGYPNLRTVIMSYFSNDFVGVIPSVKTLKLDGVNRYTNTFPRADDTEIETWGNRLNFAFPNVNYLSCEVRCIKYSFIFKFLKLKTLKLKSLDCSHVKQESDKIQTDYYWNLFTRGRKNLEFEEICELMPIQGMESHRINYPVQRPFFGDLKELEVLETLTLEPVTPLIRALIYLSQMKEIPGLKKLKATVIRSGDHKRLYGCSVTIAPNQAGTIIFKNKAKYLKKFHDKVELMSVVAVIQPPIYIYNT